MSAYNSFRGFFFGRNRHLLTEVLKGERDFDGFFMSDFLWGLKDTVAGVTAGLDMEMCNTQFYGENLVQARPFGPGSRGRATRPRCASSGRFSRSPGRRTLSRTLPASSPAMNTGCWPEPWPKKP